MPEDEKSKPSGEAASEKTVTKLEVTIPLDMGALTLASSRDPFQKADITRACQVNDEYAITFFQLDYQTLVDTAVRTNCNLEEPFPHGSTVAKVILNKSAFTRFLVELRNLAKKTDIEWP